MLAPLVLLHLPVIPGGPGPPTAGEAEVVSVGDPQAVSRGRHQGPVVVGQPSPRGVPWDQGAGGRQGPVLEATAGAGAARVAVAVAPRSQQRLVAAAPAQEGL